MNYYLLIYHVGDDYVARRAPYREEHLRLVRAANERGELILAGALADPVDQAILVFRIPDKTAIEKFIRDDPYVRHGLIKQWAIRPWTVVRNYRKVNFPVARKQITRSTCSADIR